MADDSALVKLRCHLAGGANNIKKFLGSVDLKSGTLPMNQKIAATLFGM